MRFGLQFDRKDKAGATVEKSATAPTPLPAPEKRPSIPAPADGETMAETAAAEAKPEDAASKVVKLDSFRKK